jgi:8-oxo-dGTP pyrophosphatase MutT (NUDIX family)
MKRHPGQSVTAAGILLLCRLPNKTQFLLMRHHDRWDLPKGHCQAGESFQQTALRETEEETGIPAGDISLDPDFVFELRYPVCYAREGNQRFEKQVRFFLGYLQQQPPLRLSEHESAQWFDWNPPHRIQSQTVDPLLAAADEFLRGKSSCDTSH